MILQDSCLVSLTFCCAVHFDEQTRNRTIHPGTAGDAENQLGAIDGTGRGGCAHHLELGDWEGERHDGNLAEGGTGAGVYGEDRAMNRGIVYCCDRRAGESVEDGGEFWKEKLRSVRCLR